MYTPPAFRLDDPETMHAVMRDHPFAILVAHHAGDTQIAHLPLMADGHGDTPVIRGHVARANPMVEMIEAGAPATAVFTGPHAYISPDWYAAADQVPTWNYAAVHASGTLRPVTGTEPMTGLLADLSAQHEVPLAPKQPWTHHKMTPGRMERMMKGILAFELPVERLEGKAKMSQNKGPADRERAIESLRARGGPGDLATAAWMAGIGT